MALTSVVFTRASCADNENIFPRPNGGADHVGMIKTPNRPRRMSSLCSCSIPGVVFSGDNAGALVIANVNICFGP